MIFKVRYNCPLISKSITHYLIMFVQWHRKRMALFLQMAECQMCVRIWNIQCKELTHWKRLWCWEGLGAGGEGDDRGWDGWMASLPRWTWVWVNSGSWWWTGRLGVLRFMGSQRVGHDWATELNWTELKGSYPKVDPNSVNDIQVARKLTKK